MNNIQQLLKPHHKQQNYCEREGYAGQGGEGKRIAFGLSLYIKYFFN